jgi:hypothetical protein
MGAETPVIRGVMAREAPPGTGGIPVTMRREGWIFCAPSGDTNNHELDSNSS